MDPQSTDRSYPDKEVEEKSKYGVEVTEAIASVWSKGSIVCLYLGSYFISFMAALLLYTTANLNPYVTSSFRSHSLIPVISMIAFIGCGVTQLPLARVIDVVGRVEGFIAVVSLCVFGIILKATCVNIHMYAAAETIFEVGYGGILYIVIVIVSDTAQPKNRGLLNGLFKLFFVPSTFVGPILAQAYYKHSTFRWAFGTFAIILPVLSLPVIFILYRNLRKARTEGLIEHRKTSGRTVMQSIAYYVIEIDVLGVVLACVGLTLFLLPFTIAASGTHGWSSPSIIAMIVVGFTLLVICGLYERYLAPSTFVPFRLLNDRNVWGNCLFIFGEYCCIGCWQSYFTSYLQVVKGQSIKNAGYIYSIQPVGMGIGGVLAGIALRFFGRFKPWAMVGISVMTLGCGLLIHFRHPDSPLGYLIMCQIFVGVSSGLQSIVQYVGILANAEHDTLASRVAVLYLFSYIGGAVGVVISGAIWTNTFHNFLIALLPNLPKADIDQLYTSLPVQLSYPFGSEVRNATVQAYGKVQRLLIIAALGSTVIGWVGVFLLRDINTKNVKQPKGRLL